MDDELPPKLGWNRETFLIDGKPFYPDLSDSGNTLLVRLPCEPSSNLQWDIPSTSKRILWEFSCGLHKPFTPLTDELYFQSLALACKHFSQTLWPIYKDQTLGGILYKGSANFQAHFLWNDLHKTNYETWKNNNPHSDINSFCADAFSSYFQLLAYQLPDELPLVLCFDPPPSSLSRALHLLSRERFEHFLLATSDPRWPIPALYWTLNTLSFRPIQTSTGLCFPKNGSLHDELFFQLDKILQTFYESNRPFRIVSEAFLTEEWDQLDEIHIIPQALSPQGRRKLLGFEAAGGKIREITK